MACVAALSAAAMRIMQSTLLKEQYVGYDLAVHGTATFCVPDRVDQSDNSVRTCESAGADRMVERFVHRVTTALRSLVVTRQASSHFCQIGQFVLVQLPVGTTDIRTSRYEGWGDVPRKSSGQRKGVSGSNDVAQARHADLACRFFF